VLLEVGISFELKLKVFSVVNDKVELAVKLLSNELSSAEEDEVEASVELVVKLLSVEVVVSLFDSGAEEAVRGVVEESVKESAVEKDEISVLKLKEELSVLEFSVEDARDDSVIDNVDRILESIIVLETLGFVGDERVSLLDLTELAEAKIVEEDASSVELLSAVEDEGELSAAEEFRLSVPENEVEVMVVVEELELSVAEAVELLVAKELELSVARDEL
jgi:hypothetical protein